MLICPDCYLPVHPTSDGFYQHTGLIEGPCGHRAMLDAEHEPDPEEAFGRMLRKEDRAHR